MATKADSEAPREQWWQKKGLVAFSDEAAGIEEYNFGKPSTMKLQGGSNVWIVTWAEPIDIGKATYNSGSGYTNTQGIAEECIEYGFSVHSYEFPDHGWQDGRNYFDDNEMSQWLHVKLFEERSKKSKTS